MQCQEVLDNFIIISQFLDSVTTPVTEQIGIADLDLKKHPLIHEQIEFSWIIN